MHLFVTIHTTLAKQELRWRTCRESVRVLRDARVSRLRVAALAKQGHATGQHTWVIRAVWCVTKGTVLGDRRMFPNIRPAFFGVTLKTGVVERLTDQLSIGSSSMRAVTAAAVHLSFEERVRKRFQCFAALQLMAVEADIRLCRGLHHGISRRMADVAIGAGNLVVVMWPAVPAEAGGCIVATETDSILDANLVFLMRPKLGHWRAFLAAPYAT